MPLLTRRLFLCATMAATALPVRADPGNWRAVAEAARSLDQCHALMILQGGETVLAERFRGPALERAVPIKSVSKTLIAALTGAALTQGEITSIDAPLGDVAPRLIPAGADPRVGEITIAHLVTMQMGLERTSGTNYGAWVSSRDWVANVLLRPFVAEPGAQMLYSTGAFHVLGAVLAEVSGESLLSLARARLGTPLGIDIPAWTRDPQGRYLGGNEMALTLAGMARFGELYRQGGHWQGAQVLSSEWVASSLLPRTSSPYSGLRYGYGWFLGTGSGVEYALARGYGGQVICVVPELGLSIAITSDPNRPARTQGHFGDLMQLIEDRIIPIGQAIAL